MRIMPRLIINIYYISNFILRSFLLKEKNQKFKTKRFPHTGNTASRLVIAHPRFHKFNSARNEIRLGRVGKKERQKALKKFFKSNLDNKKTPLQMQRSFFQSHLTYLYYMHHYRITPILLPHGGNQCHTEPVFCSRR